MDLSEELGYVSSSPMVGASREVQPEDELKLPVYKKLHRLIDDQIAMYSNIASLDNRKDAKFTIDQQLEVNRAVVQHLNEQKVLVQTVIGDIEELHSGR